MLVFQNKGEIDPLSVTTLGVNAKENENAIGFFGTGLKYAIAVLLRTGHKVTVHSGGKKLSFGLKNVELRGKEFQVVTMNRRDLGFTTELGKNWELWEAYRELYCNAHDEPEPVVYIGTAEPKDGYTTVTVTGKELEKVHLEESGSIVLGTAPRHTFEGWELHPAQAGRFFYRGIRVYNFTPTQTLFAYNALEQCTLTENRTLQYINTVTNDLADAYLTKCRDKELLKQVLTAPAGYMEHDFDFVNWRSTTPSAVFLEVVEELRKDAGAHINSSALKVFRAHTRAERSYAIATLTGVQSLMLNRAIAFCKRLGFPVDEYPIQTVATLGTGVLGMAEKDTIYLSQELLFQTGCQQIASCLIEEFIHLRHGFQDCTRSMQTFLFDRIVALGEELAGEPL